MAGKARIIELEFPTVIKVKYEWTADVNGNVSAQTTKSAYSGQIVSVIINPAIDSFKPFNNYNVVIRDKEGVDLLAGQGKSADNDNPVFKSREDKLGAVDDSQLTLFVTGAGRGKRGTVVLWVGNNSD